MLLTLQMAALDCPVQHPMVSAEGAADAVKGIYHVVTSGQSRAIWPPIPKTTKQVGQG